MIPICVKPYEDELLYGYFRRLSLLNGYESVYEFETTFFSVRNTTDGRRGKAGVMYGPSFVSGLWHVCHNIRKEGNETFPDFERALSMTPYRSCCQNLDEKRQARLLESVVYLPGPCVPHLIKGEKTIRICPDCIREDTYRYGEAYIHLSHNVPGAEHCKTHGTKLVHVAPPDIRGITAPIGEWLSRTDTTDTAGAEKVKPADTNPSEINPAGTDTSDINSAATDPMETNSTVPQPETVRCPDCGAQYLLHPYSIKTKAPCPACMGNMTAEEILQRRLDALLPGEYEIISPAQDITKTRAGHIPCGSTGKTVSGLLFGNHPACPDCARIEAGNLQRRLGSLPYTVIRVRDNRQSLEILHKTCGRKYTVMSARFMRKPYCPYCDGKKAEQEVDVSLVDPDYVLVGDYVNFKTGITLRHTVCGFQFRTSPSSFIHRGHRCPLCTPKYSLREAMDIIREYSDGSVEVTAETAKRGCLRLRCKDGRRRVMSFREAVFDLTRTEPKWFHLKNRPYVEKPGVKKVVYDEIRKHSRRSKRRGEGVWKYTDGVMGHITTEQEKTASKQLARMGLVKKVSAGTYVYTGNRYERKTENRKEKQS